MTDARPLPAIAIVTPSFNAAEFLEGTLESVLSQGYERLEYVVVDGASSDGSPEIIKRHEGGITKWISEPDNGHADALNKGFALTSAEVMGWINSSDVYYPWTLQTVAEIFRDLPQVEWIEGIPTSLAAGSGPKYVAFGYCGRYDLLVGTAGVQQESVFWRRSLWERSGARLDETLRLACDYELWLRFFRHAPLFHVQTVLAGFRFHDDRRGSVSSTGYEDEARRVREAELDSLAAAEQRRVALVRALRRAGGRRPAALLARARLLPGYRYHRIAYDFSQRRWRIL